MGFIVFWHLMHCSVTKIRSWLLIDFQVSILTFWYKSSPAKNCSWLSVSKNKKINLFLMFEKKYLRNISKCWNWMKRISIVLLQLSREKLFLKFILKKGNLDCLIWTMKFKMRQCTCVIDISLSQTRLLNNTQVIYPNN